MPNQIDPNVLVCARCGEDRPTRFGKSRADVEHELTPIEGLQPIYLCAECKRIAAYSANNEEIVRQQAAFNLVNSGQLTGPYDARLVQRRVEAASKRGQQ